MPNYKLTYFDARGRAEVARLLFAKAGVHYEDYRIKREEWPGMKDKTPFGCLPVLEVDGVKIAQSYAIVSYLANKFGLSGRNELDEARVHMICQCMDDVTKPLMVLMHEADAERKEKLKRKYEKDQLPNYLKYLGRLLESSGTGFFVGKDMTVADIYFATQITVPDMVGIKVNLESYPQLQTLKDAVERDPRIAEWIKSRPEAPF